MCFAPPRRPDSSPPPCAFEPKDVLPDSVFSNTTGLTHGQSAGENYGPRPPLRLLLISYEDYHMLS